MWYGYAFASLALLLLLLVLPRDVFSDTVDSLPVLQINSYTQRERDLIIDSTAARDLLLAMKPCARQGMRCVLHAQTVREGTRFLVGLRTSLM